MNRTSVHGCLTCSICGKPCPICGTCKCKKEPPIFSRVMSYIQPVKCDMCGSTAIDHTEQQCSLNRILKQGVTPSSKYKEQRHE